MMSNASIAITLLTIVGFLTFWITGGIFFAVIANSRFMRVHKVRFSCMFSVLCIGTAYGAAWMATRIIRDNHPPCLMKIRNAADVFPKFIPCATDAIFQSALLWFVLLLALGIGAMFASWSDKK